MTFEHIVATVIWVRIAAAVTLYHIVATVALDHIVAEVSLGTIVAFAIPLVAVLTSSPVIWRNEHIWNFSALQRVHISNSV
jgi:hypothetical protein